MAVLSSDIPSDTAGIDIRYGDRELYVRILLMHTRIAADERQLKRLTNLTEERINVY